MKKGFLSHYCCCGTSMHKQSTIFAKRGLLCSVERFMGETAGTTFYDGLLIVVAPSFTQYQEAFLLELQQQLSTDTQLTTTDAILNNSVYCNHIASINKECNIYAISGIEWSTLRPNTTDAIEIEQIV